MENTLKVRFKIGEIEFEAEGSADDVERERESFKNTLFPLAIDAMARTRSVAAEAQYIESGVQTPVLPAHEAENISARIDLSRTSLNEFLNAKGFKSKIDIAIGLIYYFELGKGFATFSSDELKSYFVAAKETPPGNPSDVVNKLVGKAYIMQSPEKGKYQLTRTGMDFVEQFVAPQKSDKRSSPKKSRAKIVSTFVSINADDLNLKNYPEIKLQDGFKKQMMLTLYIVCNEGHGDTFSTADVQCLMIDKLGLPATKDQVNGVFSQNPLWFTDVCVENNKKLVKHKLLTGAKDFAKTIIGDNIPKS